MTENLECVATPGICCSSYPDELKYAIMFVKIKQVRMIIFPIIMKISRLILVVSL